MNALNHYSEDDWIRLYQRLEESVGVRLFTVTRVDLIDHTFARVFSNRPEEYPVFGLKPAERSDWSDLVIRDFQTFVANSYTELKARFADHALIRSLGCESILNIPIVQNGVVTHTINLLHEKGYYSPDRVERSEAEVSYMIDLYDKL